MSIFQQQYSKKIFTFTIFRSTDRSPDSEIEMGYDVNAAIDLRLRIRKFDEENASLREEILRVEDDNAKLEKQITSLNRKL